MMPVTTAMVLPPITDQGWESGLDGTAKTRTADAPIGAISHGMASGAICADTKPVNPMPSSAPTQAINRSRRLLPASSGVKIRLEMTFRKLMTGAFRIGERAGQDFIGTTALFLQNTWTGLQQDCHVDVARAP